ncbi:hypothetical protein L218DRAFT_619883 [Marasmius fiardii PR-910]|nr:hypothetical protein L218DRAFT_619883 [Marasmius fiardii PR-910]
MDKLASELYASALYTLRRGCALWIPEPNRELTSEYCRIGVQIGDVGILRTDGSFDFIFNICYPADHDINRLNYGVPDDFEQIEWNGKKRATENYFRPGEPILSRGAKKQALGIGGTASVPGIPVGGGAGLSIKFSKDRGAVIIPPNGADSVDCQSLDDFFDYAQRHAVSWYRFVNETLRMQVENGALYLVTGFDKTDCWENAVFSHNLKERVFEIIVNTGGLAGGDGRLHLSDSSLHEAFSSRCSPANNVNHNQALFVRGYRISMHHKLKTLFGRSPVEITSTYDSLWKDVLGKKSPQFSFRRGQSSSSGSKPSSSGSGSSRGTSSSPSNACSDRSDEPQVSDVEYDSDTSSADPSSEAYDLSQVINGYILHSSSDRDDVEVVITHDEDWFALLTDEDVELPDGQELLRRLKDVFRVTVKDGCAFPARVESFHETLCQFESDYIHSAATEPMLEFGLCSLSSPFAEIGQLVEQELMKFRQINDESTTLIV